MRFEAKKINTNKVIYILNVEFEGSQNIKFGLKKFYGLSVKSVSLVLKAVGISTNFRVNFDDLNEEKLSEIKNIISDNFSIEADLLREVTKHLSKIKAVNCYKKLRFKFKLPVNGQRTSTNARTCRRV